MFVGSTPSTRRTMLTDADKKRDIDPELPSVDLVFPPGSKARRDEDEERPSFSRVFPPHLKTKRWEDDYERPYGGRPPGSKTKREPEHPGLLPPLPEPILPRAESERRWDDDLAPAISVGARRRWDEDAPRVSVGSKSKRDDDPEPPEESPTPHKPVPILPRAESERRWDDDLAPAISVGAKSKRDSEDEERPRGVSVGAKSKR